MREFVFFNLIWFVILSFKASAAKHFYSKRLFLSVPLVLVFGYDGETWDLIGDLLRKHTVSTNLQYFLHIFSLLDYSHRWRTADSEQAAVNKAELNNQLLSWILHL